jgi:RND family efflux transporter MFP subunit
LSILSSSISDLNNSSNVDLSLSTANNTLSAIQTFLQNLAFAVNKLSVNSSINQTTLTQWKSNVSISRTNIDLSMNNLSIASNQYQSAVASLNISNSQLALTKTGATNDQIKAQDAAVEQAQANLDAAKARLSKSIILSPISGVITNVNAKVGQTMQPGETAISVISFGQYDVESYVPEADIAKIKIGDVATTTLDAYGSDTFFDTSVIKIDPGETVIENVPTYKVTLKFASSSDNRIKSGMTANLDILTAQKNNVLAVPSRSVYSIDVQKYVKLVDPKDLTKNTETKVETGIRGVDGYIEIISGLKEGDKIVASPNI